MERSGNSKVDRKGSMRERVSRSAWFRQLGLSAWLIVLFVSAQLFATTHTAAHGDRDHLHEGQPCIVASFLKKTDDIDIASALPEIEEQDFHPYVPATTSVALTGAVVATSPIRAPPAA